MKIKYTIDQAQQLVVDHGADVAESILSKSEVTDADGKPVEFKIKKADTKVETIDTAAIAKQVSDEVTKALAAERKARLAGGDDAEQKFTVPAQAKRWSNTKAFKGDNAERNAYGFGLWAVSQFSKNADQRVRASKWLHQNGIISKALNEGTNAQGGDLVPDEYLPELIRLVEEYGVFRRNARVVPMMRETKAMPRRTGGVTAYFMGEEKQDTGTARTKSTPSTTKHELVAKKLTTYTLESDEIAEDAAISVGDWLAQEIALAFAQKEDECGFNGTGTSTYGGIQGITSFVGSASLVTAATGNVSFETLDNDDFALCIGKLPRYAMNGAKWYISNFGWAASMLRLAANAGGNTIQSIGGAFGMSYLGFPIELTQVLNSTSGSQVSTKVAIFGNLSMGCTFGDRRQVTVETDTSRHFDTDQIAIKGTERFDIGCHTFDSTSAAGPVIVLRTAAS